MNTDTRAAEQFKLEERPTLEVGVDICISIIITNYNARDLLKNCLDSIYKNPPQYSYEIFVVDDFSHDNSYEMVKENFPEIKLYRNEENLHYADSNNRIFDLAKGKYIYLLNSDTLMYPEAMDKMVDFLDENPNAGTVGSKLLNEDGSIQRSVKTLPHLMSGLFGSRSVLTKLFPNNRFSRRELLHLSKDMSKPFTAGYVSSASMVIRREVIDHVGYLDPRLSYHVDADYCARIWDAGWEVYYLPDAVLMHLNHKGGTLYDPKRRFKAVVEFHLGTWIYFQKHQLKSYWHPWTHVVILGLLARFSFSLVIQQVKEVFKFLKPRPTQ